MRFVGIDIGGERHAMAVVNEDSVVLTNPTFFTEDAAGYRKLRELLGDPDDYLIAMESTEHYWCNLFAFLVGEGFRIANSQPAADSPLRRGRT